MNIYKDIKNIHMMKKTAVALGAFDGIHLGHQKVIQTAIESNLSSSVFTFLENPTKSTTGKSSYIKTQEDKIEFLEKMGVENLFLIDFEEVKSLEPENFFHEILVNSFHSQVLSCGKDFRFGKGAKGDVTLLQELCVENRIKLKIIQNVNSHEERISSTKIRKALEDGDVRLAREMLGHNFYFTLPVVGGNKIGRTLGTPTINQVFPKNFILPKFGVYAVMATIDGEKHWGVSNVETKPTIGKYDPLSETWIGDFDGDLYGKNIKIEFLDFIREEKKFSSTEELKKEILNNAETAKILAEKYM